MLPQSLSDGTADHFKLLHLARGYTQLQTLKLLAPAIKYVGDLHGLAEKLLDTVFMVGAAKTGLGVLVELAFVFMTIPVDKRLDPLHFNNN